MDLGLSGRACAITGASRGIGRETARMLCAEGADVLLSPATRTSSQEATEEARAAGAEAGGCAATSPSTSPPRTRASGCWPRRASASAPLDVRGQQRRRRRWRDLDEVPDEDWRAQYELNVMAPLRAMRAATPAMSERGWGRVVNVCSTAGKRPSAAMPEYSVAKAAELSLSRLFADRYAKRGVLVNAICPGPVESEMWMEPGGLLDQSHAHVRRGEPRGGAGRRPAPSARSAGWRRSARSPRRSSSSAPSAPPTSAAPPGRWTAAPSR